MANLKNVPKMINRATLYAEQSNSSVSLTNPPSTIQRLLLCVQGKITKPNPGDTAFYSGDGVLNAVRYITVLVDDVVVYSAPPIDGFWMSSTIDQSGSSDMFQPDVNNPAETEFFFRWCMEISFDLAGLLFSGAGGIYMAQSVQIDIVWGTIDDLFIEAPGWTLSDMTMRINTIFTQKGDNGRLYRTARTGSIYPLLVAGENPPIFPAPGSAVILGLCAIFRYTDLPNNFRNERTDDAVRNWKIVGWEGDLIIDSLYEEIREYMFATLGYRVTGPTIMGLPTGLLWWPLTIDGITGGVMQNSTNFLTNIFNAVSPLFPGLKVDFYTYRNLTV
ncbi:MAG: hypothetical protein NUW37_06430 [Planctomycetes bacterium]|nr:hypothetical protein [Planctomycetota bacterium]